MTGTLVSALVTTSMITIQINGLFTWAYRSYDATIVDSTNGTTSSYSNYMDTSTIGLNGVYYLLGGNFTPFISAGIGYTYIDTNIQNGPASRLMLVGPVVWIRVQQLCPDQDRE